MNSTVAPVGQIFTQAAYLGDPSFLYTGDTAEYDPVPGDKYFGDLSYAQNRSDTGMWTESSTASTTPEPSALLLFGTVRWRR